MTLAGIHLPTLNAALNFCSAVFLLAGFYFIKTGRRVPHEWCMRLAFLTSTLFLTSYLYYHYHAGRVAYTGEGLLRAIYFFILITHIVLAAVILPLVLVTLWWTRRGDFERHRKWARVTWPLWMYVSVTGVTIYFFLY